MTSQILGLENYVNSDKFGNLLSELNARLPFAANPFTGEALFEEVIDFATGKIVFTPNINEFNRLLAVMYAASVGSMDDEILNEAIANLKNKLGSKLEN